MHHKLLVRQLRRALGVTSEKAWLDRLAGLRARGDADLADGLENLVAATEHSYEQYDRDLQVRTRMLEISSDELTTANTQLRAEADRQREVLASLQATVQRLTGARPPSGTLDTSRDLVELTHALEDLVQQREAARDQLALTEAANRRILNSLREVVFQTDPTGNWVYLNPAWAHITGFSVAESLGQRALSYIHSDDQHGNLPRITALIGRDEHYFRENMRFRTSSGGFRWLEVFARRIEDDTGHTAGLSGSLIDITDQKMAQDSLTISEQRLNQALAATDSNLWDWDMSQPQPYVDPHYLASLGYRDMGAGIEWQRQLHPDDLARWRSHLREHLRRERPELDIELRFAAANGDWRYTLLRGKVVAWEGKLALRMAGTLQDISLRKEAEAAVLRQQELTEQILDQLPIPVFLKDRAGRFVRFNRRFQELSQRSRGQMLGKKIEDFASQGWAGITQAEDAQAWASGQMITSERRLANLDPPLDMLINRIVITSGGQSYLLGFSIDISEQRAAREAMQRAVESAEAASRAKSEFLANMSHEIRTPMNGILGMTELVLESQLGSEQRDDIALVKASADALLTIINDILDFSKIEAGKLDIEEVPFDLRKLVLETARSMALRAQQKHLDLRCELPPDLPRTMKGDPGRLRQVLINLLGNAIKFTQQGGVLLTLHVGAEVDERREIMFAVTDTGIGIPPEKQALIFEAFSQVDGSTTRQYGGTGLGLTICRRLVILMHGQMNLSSEAGKGSTFSFTVPLKQTAVNLPPLLPVSVLSGEAVLVAGPDPVSRQVAARLLREEAGMRVHECANAEEAQVLMARVRPALIVLDAGIADFDDFARSRLPLRPPLLLVCADAAQQEAALRIDADATIARPVTPSGLIDAVLALHPGAQDDAMPMLAPPMAIPAPVPSHAAYRTGLRILLAEDNPVNQRLALRLLEKMGHHITLVDNGQEALERALQGGFELVLMDVQMPELDGLSATRQIRQHENIHGGHLPIIAMTARAMQGDRERCMEAGMDDYLSKPIDSGRLRQLIDQYDPEQQDPVLAWRGALQRLDGDTELLLELAGIFLDDGPGLLDELRAALQAGDASASQRGVHTLKGVLVNFGAQRAIGLTERLSTSLHQGTQREEWLLLADELAPSLEDVYAALRGLINGGAEAMR